jgi:hypothetical protein
VWRISPYIEENEPVVALLLKILVPMKAEYVDVPAQMLGNLKKAYNIIKIK